MLRLQFKKENSFIQKRSYFYIFWSIWYGARGGTRTLTPKAQVPKTCVSANFTTRAILINKIIYLINYGAFQQMVRPRGFEPLTHWLKASCSTCWAKGAMVPFIGLEPTTYWLQVSCSANWAKTAWWKLRDSNPWPLPCKGNALPAELNFLKNGDLYGTRTRESMDENHVCWPLHQ